MLTSGTDLVLRIVLAIVAQGALACSALSGCAAPREAADPQISPETSTADTGVTFLQMSQCGDHVVVVFVARESGVEWESMFEQDMRPLRAGHMLETEHRQILSDLVGIPSTDWSHFDPKQTIELTIVGPNVSVRRYYPSTEWLRHEVLRRPALRRFLAEACKAGGAYWFTYVSMHHVPTRPPKYDPNGRD